ncbi:hypothetical protein [Streptomyces sp. NPDC091212]|uniref:hypothetical protein n=1 Tax=Streptomyces sp. NPDC091212 TaxID=3155191 RepID=UPI00341627A5
MSARDDAVTSLPHGGYPHQIAREIAAVRSEGFEAGRRAALLAAADDIEALGDDHELGPGWGDAVKRLRAKAASDGLEKDTPSRGESTPGVLITCGCTGDGIVRHQDETGAAITLRCRTHGRTDDTS